MPNIYTRFKRPPKVSIYFKNPSLTEQCHKNDCEIDVILKRYQQTGFLVNPLEKSNRIPQFGDFSDLVGYQEQQNRLCKVKEHFEALPSQIRLMFGNDVGNYLQAMNDPARTEELIKLGLLKRATSDVQTPSDTSPLSPSEKTPTGDFSANQNLPANGQISEGTVTPT